MSMLRKTVLATTMLGAGLAGTAGTALADTTADTVDGSVATVSHLQTIAPVNFCNNSLDLSAADLGGLLGGGSDGLPTLPTLPIPGSGDDHGSDHHGYTHRSDHQGNCSNEVKAYNGSDDHDSHGHGGDWGKNDDC